MASRNRQRRRSNGSANRRDSNNNRQSTPAEGILEVTDRGSGWLRNPKRNYIAQQTDPLVPVDIIRRHSLRDGWLIAGSVGPGNKPQTTVLKSVDAIEETPVGDFEIPHVFEEQTVIDPQEQLRFETEGGPLTMRVVDLMTPVGKGQRGLIVAPPRTGKTILLQQLAGGVAANHPEVYTIVLLVDERPEEVTEMRRSVHGEVIASSNDLDVNTHVQVAKIAVKRAIRLTETGKDVLVLLDSLTRLGRAFNTYVGSSGRTMTGGLDIRAMEYPKRLFGAARNLEGGGSLTIVASALIDTGSRMDEFIFQEFKGTGNMELVLDRDLANLRIWPAMNIPQSGTRKEELLLDEDTLNKVNRMRRQLLDARSPQQSMQTLLEKLEQFPDNKAFLANLAD